jgi:methylenetetrahydrofolate dehydrogenase (NADP+)/methenyltetrahydrofolate cyclohydrolase
MLTVRLTPKGGRDVAHRGGGMTARIIDGKAIAAELRAKVAAEVRRLSSRHNLVPGLAVVLVGNNPASEAYVRGKAKATLEVGMRSFDQKLADTVSEADLIALVRQLNDDSSVHGILVQLPLPAAIDPHKVIEALDPRKDVDGFHPLNVGRLASGLPALVPCTPQGCIRLAKTVHSSLAGLEAIVIGRSNVVGRPLVHLLLAENATVTVAHTKTRNLPNLCRRADLVFAAAGNPGMIKKTWIRPGATVIDIGTTRVADDDGKARILGDVDFAEASRAAGAITPVPGGVGPMTIAYLLVNTVRAACAQAGLPPPVL